VQETLFSAVQKGGTELRYDWQPTVEECIRWLHATGLTMRVGSYSHEMARELASPFGSGAGVALSLSSHRAQSPPLIFRARLFELFVMCTFKLLVGGDSGHGS
jgi:hypothetical protein